MKEEYNHLSNSAKLVQEALLRKGQPFKVVELSSATRTAKEAADTLGCEIAQIVKSLIFRTMTTNQPILILASGINRVNENTIHQLVNEKIVKADANYTRDITGFAIGGIPPVGHKHRISKIFIDEDLLKFERLWAAAGTPNAVFELQSSSLLEITGGTIVVIK